MILALGRNDGVVDSRDGQVNYSRGYSRLMAALLATLRLNYVVKRRSWTRSQLDALPQEMGDYCELFRHGAKDEAGRPSGNAFIKLHLLHHLKLCFEMYGSMAEFHGGPFESYLRDGAKVLSTAAWACSEAALEQNSSSAGPRSTS